MSTCISLETDTMLKEMNPMLSRLEDDLREGIICGMLEDLGWYCVKSLPIPNMVNLVLWCMDNIDGEYHQYGHHWYFSNEKDAARFKVFWG